MRIAIVHDYIKEYGGAERVLEALHELYPKAPVFTSVYLSEYLGPHRKRFAGWDMRTSWAQFLPFKAKLISPLRLISPLLFRSFDFSSFDLIIVSATGAYFPNALRKKSAVQVCYCHTPPRYLYGYATARNWKGNVLTRSLGMVAAHTLRMVDFKASHNVDQYIANSEEVKARIEKFYRKKAVVINPPVEMGSKYKGVSSKNKKEHTTNYQLPTTGYFVAGGRLARAKHIDLIVKTCTQYGLPLKVFGKAFAGYGDELKKIADSSVEFLGEVSEEEKWELLRHATAYLFAAEDEDFGILPVEAMAAGIPVVAYRSGGVQETVVEGKTGIFFDELSVPALIEAIRLCEGYKFFASVCRERAAKFSKEHFQQKIRTLVHDMTKEAS